MTAQLTMIPLPSPLQEEESLAHEVKCFENTPQASQVKLVAQKASSTHPAACSSSDHRPFKPDRAPHCHQTLPRSHPLSPAWHATMGLSLLSHNA